VPSPGVFFNRLLATDEGALGSDVGRDRTGVIARITNFLFQQRANIEALEEQVTRGQFSMTLQATWKTRQLDRPGVEAGLAELGRSLRMEIKLRFMKILSPNFVWRFKNKISNIHPSLLPSFPGPQAYRQAYEHGVKIVGVTSHFVSRHLDEGPIIAQDSFSLRPNMTLKQIVGKGQELEAQVLLKAVKLYLAKRLDVYWGTVKQI